MREQVFVLTAALIVLTLFSGVTRGELTPEETGPMTVYVVRRGADRP